MGFSNPRPDWITPVSKSRRMERAPLSLRIASEGRATLLDGTRGSSEEDRWAWTSGTSPARVDRVQGVRRKTGLSEPRRVSEDEGRKGRSAPKATINVSGCGVVMCVCGHMCRRVYLVGPPGKTRARGVVKDIGSANVVLLLVGWVGRAGLWCKRLDRLGCLSH